MNNFIDRIWEKKFAFLGVFFLVFTISYIFLMAVDFLPEEPAEPIDDHIEILDEPEEVIKELTETQEEVGIADVAEALPIAIAIPRLDKTVTVLNPQSRAVIDLDTALLDGAVRHPDSATLTQEGNVFILGHSSYLPKVFNRNFQAFNGIQNLEWGDTIEVQTADAVYSYRVDKVYRAKAQDVTVPIAGSGYRLTLATCNSFGAIDDRYIVEAKRIEIRQL